MIHLVIVAVLVILSTAGLGLFLTHAPILPMEASSQAAIVDNLFDIHWWLIAFFVSLITVVVLYSVIVFRRRSGEQGDGKYFADSPKLEFVWTAIPIVIVLALAVVGANSLANEERRDPGALTVDVYASQWAWRFQYTVTVPAEDGTEVATAVQSDTLYLPKNRQVLLRLHSADVIHSFFVPEFRVKQDVLPGGDEFVRELRITPNEEGTYKVRCAELCGQLHYDMLADIVVVPGSEFEAWLQEESAGCNLDDAACGARWAQVFGCVACHSQNGDNGIGPTWQGLFGHEVTMTDGATIMADEAYLRESIMDPNAHVVEGFQAGVMPQNFADTLTEDQIHQLTIFIESLSQ